MAFRIRDIHAVHNNQLNKSVSKQQYTIPRAERFQRCKTVLTDKYYEIPSTNTHKGASFDRANRKSIFTIKDEKPSPGQYDVHSSNIEVRNIIFLNGRQECKKDGFMTQNMKTPGPGAYHPNPQVNFRATSKFSFNASNCKNDKSMSETPGPGSYPVRSTWLQKNKVLSTEKKSGCILIRDSNMQRMIKNGEVLDVPYYFPHQSRKGSETFNKTGGFSIGKSIRFKDRPKTQSEQPGPGSYAQFSEFI